MQLVFRSASLTMALTLSGLGLAACSTELSGFGTKSAAVQQSSAMQTGSVMAAPTGMVESSTLPPPAAPAANAAASTARTASSAVTPRIMADTVPLTPPPANPGAIAYAPTGAQDQLAGAWQFSWDNGRNTCPVKLTTARGLSGLAAQADISCPGEIFMTKGWSMVGPDIVLQNHQGKITARLSPDGPNRYVGTLDTSSQQVALVR